MQGIKKVTFGQYPDTIGYGVIGYRVLASGEPLDIGTIADLILCLKDKRIKTLQNVSLEGFDGEDINEQIMYTLCQTLKDWQYRIRIVSDGTLYHAWYKLADFLVVDIHDRMAWGRFKGNQIVFPLTADDLREPDLPALDANTALFFKPEKLTNEDMYTFLRRATHAWNMYKAYKPAMEVTVWAG